MKEIVLSKGRVAIVDDGDFDRVNAFEWRAWKHKLGYFYAIHSNFDGKQSRLMHRFILGITNPKIKVDHINGDTLDNRRQNIRLATQSQNGMNRTRKQMNNKTGFRGVYLEKKRNKFRAEISINGKGKYVGIFNTAEEAAKAFDKAAKETYGEFCGILNFPEESK